MSMPHRSFRPSASRLVATLATGLGTLALGTAVFAQTGLAPASPTAPSTAPAAQDVPGRLRATPKVTAPSDAQRSLQLNNPQPEGRVTPQIRIPLGKKSDAPVLQRRPTDTGSATPANGMVDDAAAQCEAQRGEQVRAKCRDQLARQSPR